MSGGDGRQIYCIGAAVFGGRKCRQVVCQFGSHGRKRSGYRYSRVYEAAKTLLVAHLINGKLSGDEYFAYRRGTADAVFLLDAGVVDYLGEIQERAERLMRLRTEQAEIREDLSKETKYRELVDESAQIETWFTQQFDILIAKFKPAMRLDGGC